MIIEFYGTECPHCIRMQSIVDKLKAEGVEIQAYEIWHHAENEKIFDSHDKGRCGGVPFFINPQTDAWICGATTYEDLKKLSLP